MLKLILVFAAGFAACALGLWLWQSVWSFGAQKPEDYAGATPRFDLRQALSGPMLSEGVLFDYTGRANTRFIAEMTGLWSAEGGALSETFRYDTGGVQSRRWEVSFGKDGRFTATAGDIVGEATGIQSGDTAMLRYRLRLPEEAGGHVLDVTDWMYLMENGVVMNRSQMRKHGVLAAELIAVIRKAPAEEAAQATPAREAARVGE